VPKRLLVAAGPNGSGKSTIFNRAKSHPLFPPFFISPDEEAKKEPFNRIEDEIKRYIAAMTYCEDLRNALMGVSEDLAFETVFSTKEKLDFLRRGQSCCV
jgi:predicted ABC-type ATPase